MCLSEAQHLPVAESPFSRKRHCFRVDGTTVTGEPALLFSVRQTVGWGPHSFSF